MPLDSRAMPLEGRAMPPEGLLNHGFECFDTFTCDIERVLIKYF